MGGWKQATPPTPLTPHHVHRPAPRPHTARLQPGLCSLAVGERGVPERTLRLHERPEQEPDLDRWSSQRASWHPTRAPSPSRALRPPRSGQSKSCAPCCITLSSCSHRMPPMSVMGVPAAACRLDAMWRSRLAHCQAPYRVSREALAAAGARQAPHSRRRRNSCDARAPQCVTRQACAHESKAMFCSHGA